MHHFQLKPVRSLDSLRPAWSGHLRHGPPPSTVIVNPSEASSAKTSSRLPHSFLNSSSDQANVLSDARPTDAGSVPSDNSFNSSPMKCNRKMEQTKTSFAAVARKLPETLESNDSLDVRANMGLAGDCLNSATRKVEVKQQSKIAGSSKKNFDCQNIFTSYDSVSNPVCHLKEDDPFDTSKVFIRSYMQTSLFQPTSASLSVNSHVPSHAFDSTPCSAHVKVNHRRSLFIFSVNPCPVFFKVVRSLRP